MQVDFAAEVNIGPKETNDDRVLVGSQILDEESLAGSVTLPAIAAVCDGCGGYAGGNIAAQTVLELLSSEDVSALADVNCLSQALLNCQQAVLEKKAALPQYSAMCTTIAGCIFCDDCITIFHAGDSRVYRCDTWGIAKMTVDHSVVQNMVDLGRITEDEAQVNPHRNTINRCIGLSCPPPEIYVSRSPICAGEKYLLCSDGLWESVSDVQIEEILSAELPLPQMAETLVKLAIEQGSDDNISVCIVASKERAKIIENKPFILD